MKVRDLASTFLSIIVFFFVLFSLMFIKISLTNHLKSLWGFWGFGVLGYGGSVWVMGEWAMGYWIVSVTSFQKIYGLYNVEHH